MPGDPNELTVQEEEPLFFVGIKTFIPTKRQLKSMAPDFRNRGNFDYNIFLYKDKYVYLETVLYPNYGNSDEYPIVIPFKEPH